jgi:hypothetical protein
MNIGDLQPGPIRHAQLAPSLVHRVETICSALGDVFPMSADQWIDSLRRDLSPENEVLWWERVAGCYVELSAKTELLLSEKQSAFKIIFSLFSGIRPKDLTSEAAKLPDSARKELAAILRKFAKK